MQQLSITWFGHATFILKTPGGKRVLLDPWLTDNPSCPEAAAKACTFLGLRKVVPMHWGTFSLLTGRPEQFRVRGAKGNGDS